jgi:hypothetical protein
LPGSIRRNVSPRSYADVSIASAEFLPIVGAQDPRQAALERESIAGTGDGQAAEVRVGMMATASVVASSTMVRHSRSPAE